jgi:antibiotic biosynthesis monooxygenase (ABM) superfamily enzyme
VASVHIAITRQVKPGMEQAFENALRAFARESLHVPGTTGIHLVSPAGTDSREYGILRSFESESARDTFYDSEFYAKWQHDVAPMVIGAPSRRELHGLEAFFRGAGEPPPRWKMAVVTWMGVFPAVLLWSSIVPGYLPALHPIVVGAIVDVFVVATLAWCFMPLLTKLFSAWLRPGRVAT